jgi:hypothetical protein
VVKVSEKEMEKISPKKEKKDENPTKTRLMKQADA